ncbi:hypothetical protein FQN53_009592 [Emmonsiellopsis sp. PD_33]|nr:hypothetical protein FQN53_009592 [Emmonsiellopsis sp. PD_33]KAK2807116.1 hypothetical protein FQN51_004730 [Onygenales sp. PD_10]
MAIPLSTSMLLILGCLAGIVATIISAYAWFRTSKFYLPLPTSLAGITTFLPIATALLIPLASNIVSQARNRRPNRQSTGPIDIATLLTILDQLLTIFPTILASLSISYFAPEDIVSCRLENQWQSYYSNKNANAIRAIQDRLQCCGFRSTRDRAWPFPGGSEHRDCPSTFGYTESCFAGWRDTERGAAAMVFAAAVLSLVMKYILSSRRYDLTNRSALGYRQTIDDASGPQTNGSHAGLITDGRYCDEPGEEDHHRSSSSTQHQMAEEDENAAADEPDESTAAFRDEYHEPGHIHISNLRV